MSQIVSVKLILICGLILASSIPGLSQTATRPEPINAPIPAYPPMARAKRIHGVVLVDVQIGREGNVTDAVALMGAEYLRDAAVKAARGWRFKPMQSDLRDNYSVRLTFIFHEFSYRPPEKKPDFRSPYQIEILYPE